MPLPSIQNLKCGKCGAAVQRVEDCGCWQVCSCGWTCEKGTFCLNPNTTRCSNKVLYGVWNRSLRAYVPKDFMADAEKFVPVLHSKWRHKKKGFVYSIVEIDEKGWRVYLRPLVPTKGARSTWKYTPLVPFDYDPVA